MHEFFQFSIMIKKGILEYNYHIVRICLAVFLSWIWPHISLVPLWKNWAKFRQVAISYATVMVYTWLSVL